MVEIVVSSLGEIYKIPYEIQNHTLDSSLIIPQDINNNITQEILINFINHNFSHLYNTNTIFTFLHELNPIFIVVFGITITRDIYWEHLFSRDETPDEPYILCFESLCGIVLKENNPFTILTTPVKYNIWLEKDPFLDIDKITLTICSYEPIKCKKDNILRKIIIVEDEIFQNASAWLCIILLTIINYKLNLDNYEEYKLIIKTLFLKINESIGYNFKFLKNLGSICTIIFLNI